MVRRQVVSSNIKSVGYDPDSRTLEIEFLSGAVYQYSNVNQELYENMMKAPSVCRYLNAFIKPRPEAYPCKKILSGLPT